MKLKNTKIANQLSVGLTIILILAAIMGTVSLYDSASLWQSTKTMYEHPLAVRTAIGALEADVLNIRLEMKEMVLANNEQTTQGRLKDISTYEADANKQFDILYSAYLGPKTDIDNTYNSFVQWKPIREETIRLMQAGKISEAMARTSFTGVGGIQAGKVVSGLSVIDTFARNKAASLYIDAQQHKNHIVLRLAILFASILLLIGAISYIFRRSISAPLKALTAATKAFEEGKPDAKCSYESKNEFGLLSDNFNDMVDSIQSEIAENASAAEISEAMMVQNDLRPFCESLLKTLLLHTDSQLGAVYLKNEETKSFDYFESIGLSTVNRTAFSFADKEGEFGTALANGEMQHIKEIPPDAGLAFSAVSGDYKVREIMTIPAIKGTEVVAVLSIAGIKEYSESHLRIIEKVTGEISARLNSVLASQKILDFSKKLQANNIELEQQAKELTRQTDELTEQNIELEMQKKQLDEANRLKSTFLSNMSHELRTPLNSVIALTSVLNRRLKGKIPEDEYSYLDVIERNGKGLLALINELLDLSRIEAGKEEISLSKFDLKELVGEVLEMLDPQAKNKAISLAADLPAGELKIVSDEVKCRHILQNIIGNAVKFTDNGGVTVSLAADIESFHIMVKDTGIGIAPSQIGFIFDEFRQADETPSRKAGGTGLGLSIAKNYAKLLGGNITVESELGKGSVFTITLLQKIGNAELQKSDNSMNFSDDADDLRPALPANEIKRVLLIEDNESAIIQTTDFLLEKGYDVYVSRSGKEALEQIEQVKPDGIILDLMMPEMDGFQTLKAIRELDKFARIPVLILSAKHITKEELNFLKSNHVYQLIQKGAVEKKELLAAIDNLVNNRPIKAGVTQKKVSAKANERHTILVVEDNPDNMITVNAILEKTFDVEKAVNGIMGVEKAKKVKPSLILMDISLPDMNGFQAFMAIRKIDELKQIPVIAMTASAMAGNKEEILEYGFDGYISKPIDIKEFEEVIGRYLNGE
ncbi:MAG: response regulator [Eubacteriales bacterium]